MSCSIRLLVPMHGCTKDSAKDAVVSLSIERIVNLNLTVCTQCTRLENGVKHSVYATAAKHGFQNEDARHTHKLIAHSIQYVSYSYYNIFYICTPSG